jgi:hypothetical protein
MSLIALARVLAEPRGGDPPPGFFSGLEQAAIWTGLRVMVVLVSMASASRLAKRPLLAA